MTEEAPTYRVAVRALCDFTARRGDLDHRFTPAPSARDGIAGHARVVARRGADYRAELPLAGEFREAGVCLVVRGRADGYAPGEACLEEIKTHRGDLSRQAANQRALHWAQARTYGALLCRAEGLARVTIRLVYLEITSGEETRLDEMLEAAELEAEFIARCRDFLAWARQESAHRRARDAALARLRFPHEAFRPGQRALAEAAYKAAATGRCLLAQAPTGIGKTLGTLFPLLTAMPRQGLDRLAFLTMKTPGRRLALDALASLGAAEGQPPLRVLELIARDKACEYPGTPCQGEACPLAEGFYDRLPAARRAAVARGWLDRQALRELALAHRVCPYYLGQELARWCDVIVGDVNHYFDDTALLHGLAQADGWRLGLLVDEAHNLVGRARGMYSAELDQARLNRLKRDAPAPLKGALARLSRQWQALVRESDLEEGSPRHPAYAVLEGLPGGLVGALQGLVTRLGDHLVEHPGQGEWQELLFEVLAFVRLAERFGDHSLCDLARRGRGKARLGLRNLVPADFLAPRFAAAHCAVLFSATLSPAAYHRDLLGLPEGTVWQTVPAPFRAEQLEVRVRSDISTRLADRPASLGPIVATLADQYRRRPGHYLAFFSSFAYLEAAREALAAAHPEIPQRHQARGMDEAAREAFLASFAPGGRGIGFAVLGGAFGEGIDLPGERLIGAFIVTLGLPPSDPFNEALRARLQARFGCGYDYAYRIPGLTKVVQAAGRVIRGPEDEGVVVLMDERFARPEVRALLPEWWG